MALRVHIEFQINDVIPNHAFHATRSMNHVTVLLGPEPERSRLALRCNYTGRGALTLSLRPNGPCHLFLDLINYIHQPVQKRIKRIAHLSIGLQSLPSFLINADVFTQLCICTHSLHYMHSGIYA